MQFYFKVRDVLIGIGCTQSSMDSALFVMRDTTDKLIGMVGLHVDDFLHCGPKEFENLGGKHLTKVFFMGKIESKNVIYVGFDIEQGDDAIKVNQRKFVNEIIFVLLLLLALDVKLF